MKKHYAFSKPQPCVKCEREFLCNNGDKAYCDQTNFEKLFKEKEKISKYKMITQEKA